MFYRDEVRDFDAIHKAERSAPTPTEIDLAKGLVELRVWSKNCRQKILRRKLTKMNTVSAYSPCLKKNKKAAK